ncbi:hypothetical protein QF050_002775 [Arthrobacter sp. SLBN-112]|nr:hypothetical protein [Arthrobacter sp. SLBN-112]
MSIVMNEKNGSKTAPVTYMLVGPDGHRESRNGDRGVDQSLVTEDRLAAEDREDLRDDTEERQRDDVHLRVAEEPEQVLPEDGTAVRGIEDVGAELPVRAQGKEGCRQRREGHEYQDRRDQGVPGEDRHPPHGHARGTHADDGRDEVDRAEDGAEAGQGQAEDPEVTADARGKRGVRERRVGEPAKGSSALRGDEARHRDGGAEEEEPERQGVQARERDVRSTDLQRHDHVGKPGEERGGEHQEHDGSVHGEQLVVLFLGLQDLHAGLEQLGADQQRHHAAEAEEHKRCNQVHVPDGFVVRGGDPVDDDAPLGLWYHWSRQGSGGCGLGVRSHVAPLTWFRSGSGCGRNQHQAGRCCLQP